MGGKRHMKGRQHKRKLPTEEARLVGLASKSVLWSIKFGRATADQVQISISGFDSERILYCSESFRKAGLYFTKVFIGIQILHRSCRYIQLGTEKYYSVHNWKFVVVTRTVNEGAYKGKPL